MQKTSPIPEIMPLTDKKVPSVLGMDANSGVVIGDSARNLGLQGRTNTYHFKTELGKPQDDSLYEARERAGRRIAGRTKPFWIRNPDSGATRTFTPLEAAREFLGKLIPGEDRGSKALIVGEPPLEGVWKENYRRNMRRVLSDLGFQEPQFFPEPFAVYQYYRHIEKRIPHTDEAQTVLVIDFGGGTFDCCVIRTTKTGELARSGAHSLPLGFHSSDVAGESVDIELLKIVHSRAKSDGLVFKEDPIDRARKSAQSLWAVEDVKIRLSERMNRSGITDKAGLRGIEERVRLPAGAFHSDKSVECTLSSDDLQSVVNELWRRTWGSTLLKCHRESDRRLGQPIEKYDVVLVAGGSAHLPNLATLIRTTLPTYVTQSTKVVIGGYAGAAVAQGIAIECKEQSDRRPELVNERLVSCLLNSVYVRIGRQKAERESPRVRSMDSALLNRDGLVYETPGILEGGTIHCQLEHRTKPRGVLHYWFHGSKAGDDDPMNVASTTVRIPGDGHVDRKFQLSLEIEPDGMITPHFLFKRSGKALGAVTGQPFNLGGQQIAGRAYLGVDFGTCNSYVASFIAPDASTNEASYPDYSIARDTTASLLKLEARCSKLRGAGVLCSEALLEHARRNELDFIFHSNKIEGNKLSKGQTESALKSKVHTGISKDQREALNLRDTYEWLLDHFEGAVEHPAAFARELNRRLLDGIESNAGAFRTEDVTINGVAYKPPPWGSVDAYMTQFGKELGSSEGRTSGLELAVRAHTKLAAIHPFVDGNGRTARLLAAAILLAHGLPVVVLNSGDKGRYLDALEKSNTGTLDSLLKLFAELLEASLEELENHQAEVRIYRQEGANESIALSEAPAKEREGERSRGHGPETPHSRFEAVSKAQTASAAKKGAHARLVKALRKKKNLRREIQKATYPAWRSAFEMFRNELDAYTAQIDGMEDFREAGYELRVEHYDIVSEDRFEEFWTRRDQSNTWFCTIEISNAMESTALMLQFGRCSHNLRGLGEGVAPVSCHLAIGGQERGVWLPLRDEPIRLREIGYANGELIFLDYGGSRVDTALHELFDDLIADVLE